MSGVEIIKVKRTDDGMRLDRWFKLNVPLLTHGMLQKALRKGQVRLDGKRVKASDHVSAGQEVRVPPISQDQYEKSFKPKEKKKFRPSKEQVEKFAQALIFENEELAVFNKPQGLAVQGGIGQSNNVDVLLPYVLQPNEETPKLVHRIDKDTTGILVVAKTRQSAARLTAYFKKKTIHKRYLAMVMGVPIPREGTIDLPLAKGDVGNGKEKMMVDKKNGQASRSRYRVIDFAHQKAALVELEPVTGRTHQLRVHMAAIGHPIIGDVKYGGQEALLDQADRKLHLHAWQLTLPSSSSNKKEQLFEAELPAHLSATMDLLGLSV